MDRKWYIDAGELLLSDTASYTRIESFDINSTRNELLFILASSGQLRFTNVNPQDFYYASWNKRPLQEIKDRHISWSSNLADILLEPFLDPSGIQVCRQYLLPKLHKLPIPFPCPPPLLEGESPPV